MCDEDECFGAFNGSLEVFGQAATVAGPRGRSFDDPSTGQRFEAYGPSGTFDDLDRPVSVLDQGVA